MNIELTNIIEVAGRLTAALDAWSRLMRQVPLVLKVLRPFLSPELPRPAYENLSLDAALDIRDADGKRAVLHRRQRVRFRVKDGAVVRDLMWGDGDLIAHYAVKGGRRLSVTPEGSKRVILLGLAQSPSKTGCIELRSRRVVRDGLTGESEYFEAMVERPTGRLALKVLFPSGRPPKEAYLVLSPPGETVKRVPIHCAADGRPYLTWLQREPKTYHTYSIRWSW
jgi:hypothetical protein